MYSISNLYTKYIIALSILLIVCFIIYLKFNNTNKSKLESVSPYVVHQSLLNNDKKIILVNVLSDKIPYLINCNGSNNRLSLTEDQFDKYINKNSLQDIDLVILYCASWSCGAAHNYYDKLKKKGINMNNIYDYKGALHEWAMYSIIYPNIYNLFNLKSSNKASESELRELVKGTMHTYILQDEKLSSNNTIKNLVSKH